MDYRCLYGHRIPEHFTFSIQQRLCPTCGAPCVTLDGYRLARRLCQEVPLEAIAAFNVVRLIETHYTLTARAVDGADTPASGEVASGAAEPAEEPSQASALDVVSSARGDTVELPQAAKAEATRKGEAPRLMKNPGGEMPDPGADAPPPRRRQQTPGREEAGFDDLDNDFFQDR